MHFKNNKKGAALTEYAMIAGLIGVVTIGTVFATGTEVSEVFATANTEITTAKTSEANENILQSETSSAPPATAVDGDYVPASSSFSDAGFDLYFSNGSYYDINPGTGMTPSISASRPDFGYNPYTGNAWGVSLGGVGHIYRGNINTLEVTAEFSANNIDYVSLAVDSETGGTPELFLTVDSHFGDPRHNDSTNFHFDIYDTDTFTQTKVAIPVADFQDIDTLVAGPYSDINYQPYKVINSVSGGIATMTAYANVHGKSGATITYTIDFNTMTVTKN